MASNERLTPSTYRCVALAALFLLVSGLANVDARADSIFGLSYFGGNTWLADARIEGRGGTGYAYRDSLNASTLLPTQLADMKRVTIGITSQFERHEAEDSFGQLNRNGLVTPTIRLGLPLGSRAGAGIGFQADRATQWQLSRPFADDPTVAEKIEREGTQFVIPIQLGYRLSQHLTLGAGARIERGTVRLRYDLDLPGSNEVDPSEVREDISTSVAWEVALALYDLGPFSIAGSFVPEHDANVDIRRRGVALSNREDAERDDTLPARWGVGTRVDLPGAWSAGLDFEDQLWKDYRGRSFTDVNGDSAQLQDEWELRLGVEKEAERIGVRQTTPLRAGAYYRRWNYQLRGADVTEWGVTVGTGIALRNGGARADLSAGFGRIGNLSDNGAQENVFRLIFSIAGGERWY